MKFFFSLSKHVHQILHTPMKVFWGCFTFVAVSLLLNGSLLRLYGLHRDELRLKVQTQQVNASIIDLDRQLTQARDPAYLERQAMDRYDLADENDLVFVFSEDQ